MEVSTERGSVESSLRKRGALLEGHIQLLNGKHCSAVVDKATASMAPYDVEMMAIELAKSQYEHPPDVVIGHDVYDIQLAHAVAAEFAGVWEGGTLCVASRAVSIELANMGSPLTMERCMLDSSCIEAIRGKRVLIVSIVLQDESHLRELIQLVRYAGADTITLFSVAACTHLPKSVDNVDIQSMFQLDLRQYPKTLCAMCAKKEPWLQKR